MIYKGNNTYNLNSCEIIELFYNIRIDMDKLNTASYITKIINDVTTENQNNYKVLRLFLNTLYTISETEKDLNLIMAVFKLRLISTIGLMPKIKSCVGCNKEDITYFSLRSNGFMCKFCGKQDKSSISMLISTKDAIRYSITAPLQKLYSFQIPEESVKELGMISKLYLNEKLEKEYK